MGRFQSKHRRARMDIPLRVLGGGDTDVSIASLFGKCAWIVRFSYFKSSKFKTCKFQTSKIWFLTFDFDMKRSYAQFSIIFKCYLFNWNLNRCHEAAQVQKLSEEASNSSTRRLHGSSGFLPAVERWKRRQQPISSHSEYNDGQKCVES